MRAAARTLLAIGAFVALAVVGGTLVGLALPASHVAARTMALHKPPDAVWAVAGDLGSAPEWKKAVLKVERVPDGRGRELWRETSKMGSVLYETVERRAPSRLVRRIADPASGFQGEWTFEIAPAPEGSRVSLTERADIKNPLFRFVYRFVFGHHRFIDAHLRALARRLGEKAELR